MFTGGTDPICESDKHAGGLRTGSLWAHYSEIFSDVGEKVMGGGRRHTHKKKALFSLSRCAKTQPCCSIPFSRSVKTISGFREESVYSVAWFTGVTSCSHRANPLFSLQNGLHIFPVTQDLKRTRGNQEVAAAIISGFTCSQLLGRFKEGCVTTMPPTSSITVSVNGKPIMAVMFRGVSLSRSVLEV